MKYLIQNNLLNNDQLILIREAIQNLPHQFIGMIPFSREIISNEPITGSDFIPYGSTLLTSVAYEDYHWFGTYFSHDRFNYDAFRKNRSDMLNDYLVMPVNKTIEFMQACEPHESWFVRPSLDTKQFGGQVLEAKECADWLQDAVDCDSSGSYRIAKDTMIVIAPPQDIQAEWRWFIVGGKVIDGSMYRCHGQLKKEHVVDQDLIDEAQVKADGWLPDSCCVMDTALVNDQLKVIEFNCINSSGFYDHDIRLILNEFYNYTTRKKDATNQRNLRVELEF